MTEHDLSGASTEPEAAQSLLLDIALSSLEHQDFAHAAQHIFESCKNAIGATAGYVALLSSDGLENEVMFLDAGGMPCSVDPTLPMPIRGLREQAYRSMRAVANNEFATSEWWQLMPDGHANLENVLFAPLVLDGEAAGIMGFANKPGGFDANDLALATTFGTIAAIALRDARTLEELIASEARLAEHLAHAEAEAARERTRARSYLDASEALLVGLSADGAVRFANRTICELLEVDEAELLGRDWPSIAFPEQWREHAISSIRRALTGESTPLQSMESSLVTPSGERHIVWRHTVVTDENGLASALMSSGEDITLRRRAEQRWRESQQRLELAVWATDVGFWDLDLTSDEVFFSQKWKAQLGYADDEIVNDLSEWRSRLHPDDRAGAEANLAAYVRSPFSEYVNEFRMRHKEGCYRWILSHGRAILDEEEKPVRLLGTHIDITDRKRSERAAEIVEGLHEFARLNSLDSLLVETLDQTCELLDSRIGFYHFVEADEQKISLRAWSTATAKFCHTPGQTGHGYDVTQAGVWIDCIRERRAVVHNDYASLPNRRGLPEGHAEVVRELVVPIFRGQRIVAILGVGNKSCDYTEQDVQLATHIADVAWEVADRKRSDDALRESEERFRMSLELSPEPVFLVRDGVFVFVNKAGLALLGDDLLGQSVIESVHPDYRELVRSGLRSLSQEATATPAEEIQLLRSDGSVVDVEATSAVLPMSEGPTIEVALRDITERKAIQAEVLRQQERLAELATELLHSGAQERSRIAVELHDGVGQALAAAKLNAQRLAAELPDSADGESAQLLVVALETAIGDVRSITSELNPPLLQAFGLGAALERLAESFLSTYGLACDVHVEPAAHQIKGDTGLLLHRSATELLNNVQRHSGVRSAQLSVRIRGSWAILRVEDRGCGFDPEAIGTTNDGHVRFGLSSIRERMWLVGGHALIDSTPGHGTRVEVRVPLDYDRSAPDVGAAVPS